MGSPFQKLIRVEAGAASKVKNTRIPNEWRNSFLDISALDEGIRTLADLFVGRLDGVVLSWHVGIPWAVTIRISDRRLFTDKD